MSNNCSPFRLCYCAVFFVVLLRIAIGWHYFYEGIHKFDPAEEFSAEGFLGIAKGPTAELYYAMLPDLDGLGRLEIGNVTDEKGKERKTFIVYENAWKDYYDRCIKKHPDIKEAAAAVFDRYLESLRAGAAETEKDIAALKESKQRFEELKDTVQNGTDFEQKRRWDAMMKYRSEAKGYTKMLTDMGNGLQSDLNRLVKPELAGSQGQIATKPEWGSIADYTPFLIPVFEAVGIRGQMRLMDLAVMYGLSAIGICMILGFCNRLACLGGIAFLVNVVLTTFPVPGVHPALPSAVGNFMFVSKDVVEMIAMLFLASIPAGRWAGLDYFLYHYGGKQILRKVCPFCTKIECPQ